MEKKDFIFKEIIGEGSTCVVYKAKYLRNEISYAIKVIPKMEGNLDLTLQT